MLKTTLFGDVLVATGERNRLEGNERNLLRVFHRELDDRADLVVVDPVDQRRDQDDVDTRLVQVIDRAQFHVEEIADLPMAVLSENIRAIRVIRG